MFNPSDSIPNNLNKSDSNLFSSPNSGLGEGIDSLFNFLSGRSGQAELQTEQQRFDEYMYTEYNSPQALKRQFEEAGLNTNLLGSTSFGTAQSSAGAPGVNPNTPIQSGASALQSIGTAASQFADPALKASQIPYYESFPAMNKALTDKYGKESQLTEQEFRMAQKTYDWSLQDREFNYRNLKLSYYQACQMLKNSEQEFENLIKEGKVLDEEKERLHWEATIKQQVADFFVENHFFPDQNYLDFLWNNFIINGDSTGFNRFLQGSKMLWDEENMSGLMHGKFGGKIKLGGRYLGAELDLQVLLAAIEGGKDIADAFKSAMSGDWNNLDESSSSGDSSNSADSGESQFTESQLRHFHSMDDIIRAVSAEHPDWEMTDNKMTEILRKEGYSYAQIGMYLNRYLNH